MNNHREKILREGLEYIARHPARVPNAADWMRYKYKAEEALAEADALPKEVCGTCRKYRRWDGDKFACHEMVGYRNPDGYCHRWLAKKLGPETAPDSENPS